MFARLNWIIIGAAVLALTVGCDSTNGSNGSGAATTTTIDEEGGVAESADNMARVEFPEGALSGPAEVTITEESTPDRDDLYTNLYSFSVDAQFESSVTVEIDPTRELTGDQIRLGRFVDGQVEEVGFSGVSDGVVRGALSDFSTYGGFDFGSAGEPVTNQSTIDSSGGVAESADGLYRITFAPDSFDADELSVTIMEDQSTSDHAMAGPYRVSKVYSVVVFPEVTDLDPPASIALEITEDVGDNDVFLLHSDSAHGLSGRSSFDGSQVTVDTADASSSDLTGGSYAVSVALTSECAGIEPLGTPCTDDGDECYGDDPGFVCECADGNTIPATGSSGDQYQCHASGVCRSVLLECAGIGIGHGGLCEDLGGWTGGCTYE